MKIKHKVISKKVAKNKSFIEKKTLVKKSKPKKRPQNHK